MGILDKQSSSSSVISGIMNDAANIFYDIYSKNDSRDWQVKLWNMQNAYNTPAEQMKRLQEAGLNPDLAYGQLSTEQSQMPSVNSSHSPLTGLRPMESDSQSQLNEALKNKAQAEADKTGQETQEMIATFSTRMEQLVAFVAKTKEEINKLSQDIRQSQQYVDVMKSTIKLNDSSILLQGKQGRLVDSQNLFNQASTRNVTALAEWNEQRNKYATDYFMKSLSEIDSRIQLNSEQASFARANAKLTWDSLTDLVNFNKYRSQLMQNDAGLSQMRQDFFNLKPSKERSVVNLNGEPMNMFNQMQYHKFKAASLSLDVLPYQLAGSIAPIMPYIQTDFFGDVKTNQKGIPKLDVSKLDVEKSLMLTREYLGAMNSSLLMMTNY